jgi:hypothetical protein
MSCNKFLISFFGKNIIGFAKIRIHIHIDRLELGTCSRLVASSNSILVNSGKPAKQAIKPQANGLKRSTFPMRHCPSISKYGSLPNRNDISLFTAPFGPQLLKAADGTSNCCGSDGKYAITIQDIKQIFHRQRHPNYQRYW